MFTFHCFTWCLVCRSSAPHRFSALDHLAFLVHFRHPSSSIQPTPALVCTLTMYPGHSAPPSVVRMVDEHGRLVHVDTDSLPPAVAYQCLDGPQHAMPAAPVAVASNYSRSSPPPPTTTAPPPAPYAPAAHPSRIASAGRTCAHWTLRYFLPLVSHIGSTSDACCVPLQSCPLIQGECANDAAL